MTFAHWKAVVVYAVAAGAAVLIGLVAGWYEKRGRVRSIVFSDLDNAAENGYFGPGKQCHGMSPDELAYDLVCDASNCENFRPEQLTPYVREWLRKHKW